MEPRWVFLDKSKSKRWNPGLRFPSKKREELKRQRDEEIEQNAAPSGRLITFYDLPMEILDMILKKSFLHWIMNSTTKQRDYEDVIRSLSSVEVCFYQRVKKKRFKRSIWRNLKKEIRLRAVCDFNPKDMTQREEKELREILRSRREMKKRMVIERYFRMQKEERLVRHKPIPFPMELLLEDQTETQEILNARSEMIIDADTDQLRTVHGLENTEKLKDLHFEKPEGNINPYDGFMTSAIQSDSITEDTTYTHLHDSDDFDFSEDDPYAATLTSKKVDDSDERTESDDSVDSGDEKEIREPYCNDHLFADPCAATLTSKEGDDSDERTESDGSVDSFGEKEIREAYSNDHLFTDPCAAALAIKSGDEMEAIPYANIGDKIGWWIVKHLTRGEIGFIPRRAVVIEHVKESSKTALYDLPLEILDMIVQKSYLRWILNSPTKYIDEYVIRSLMSVDVCFNQRITRNRSKRPIRRFIRDFYGKTKKIFAIIKSNRKYLSENIEPNDKFISLLLSHNCITQEQGRLIQRQNSTQDKKANRGKNKKLLYVAESFDEAKFSKFVKCLRQTNQETVARIMEDGGVVCAFSASFVQGIKIQKNRDIYVHSVTKLRNEIYILFGSSSRHPPPPPSVIDVFEDQKPFKWQKEIKLTEIRIPDVIGSNENENCIYVTNAFEKCVWKITREEDGGHKIIKWLTFDYIPEGMSVSTGDQFFVLNKSTSSLMIYGLDAKLIRYIKLPTNIMYLRHAVETSIGNIIILHRWIEEKVDSERFARWGGKWVAEKWVISELSKDGKTVTRRFIPSNEKQLLKNPLYLFLDSEDRVFVADTGNNKVILLDSDLRWSRILYPTGEKEEPRIHELKPVCYDEAKKQLIVAGNQGEGEHQVNIYSISWK